MGRLRMNGYLCQVCYVLPVADNLILPSKAETEPLVCSVPIVSTSISLPLS